MESKYRIIGFGVGDDIDSAMYQLKNHQDLVCGEFNGKMLYSDIDDLDSAYKKITGKSKSEFEEKLRQGKAKYEREKLEYEQSIPSLTIEWVEKGKSILDKKHHKLWAEIVPVRLGDLYRGMELGNCLEIVEQLNKGEPFDSVKPLIINQGHSGMSFGLVCSMIREFADRGEEFVAYIRTRE